MHHLLTSPHARLMRLNQPVGIWLLLWPCFWSVALAASDEFPIITYLLLALGAVLMRSAGCIVNDIADRDIDRQVERTKTRPLASGELTLKQALILLAVLLVLSLGVAVALGPLVIAWAAAALPLVAAYPFMKRITWWPQLFLGLTFNWGALLGWVAATGENPSTTAWLLYSGGVLWTLGYDTIYAHQDKKDDARIGVRSTALRLGKDTLPKVRLWYGIGWLLWLAAGVSSHSGMLYNAGLLIVMVSLLHQTRDLDLDDPENCKKAFISNIKTGALLWASCIAGGF